MQYASVQMLLYFQEIIALFLGFVTFLMELSTNVIIFSGNDDILMVFTVMTSLGVYGLNQTNPPTRTKN